MKAELVHASDPRRQRDKSTHHWKQAAHQNSDTTILVEEMFGPVEVMAAEEKVAAKSVHGWTASPASQPVGRN